MRPERKTSLFFNSWAWIYETTRKRVDPRTVPVTKGGLCSGIELSTVGNSHRFFVNTLGMLLQYLVIFTSVGRIRSPDEHHFSLWTRTRHHGESKLDHDNSCTESEYLEWISLAPYLSYWKRHWTVRPSESKVTLRWIKTEIVGLRNVCLCSKM